MSKGFYFFLSLFSFFSSLTVFFFFVFQGELGNAEQWRIDEGYIRLAGKKGTARAPVLPPCSEATEFNAVVGGCCFHRL